MMTVLHTLIWNFELYVTYTPMTMYTFKSIWIVRHIQKQNTKCTHRQLAINNERCQIDFKLINQATTLCVNGLFFYCFSVCVERWTQKIAVPINSAQLWMANRICKVFASNKKNNKQREGVDHDLMIIGGNFSITSHLSTLHFKSIYDWTDWSTINPPSTKDECFGVNWMKN